MNKLFQEMFHELETKGKQRAVCAFSYSEQVVEKNPAEIHGFLVCVCFFLISRFLTSCKDEKFSTSLYLSGAIFRWKNEMEQTHRLIKHF